MGLLLTGAAVATAAAALYFCQRKQEVPATVATVVAGFLLVIAIHSFGGIPQ